MKKSKIKREKDIKTMYNWYVSFITDEGTKVKKVKANSKHEAIQKASKALNCYRLKECKLIK